MYHDRSVCVRACVRACVGGWMGMDEWKCHDDAVLHIYIYILHWLILYDFTHCDDLYSFGCLLLLFCAFYVRDDTAMSHNGMNKVFCILFHCFAAASKDTGLPIYPLFDIQSGCFRILSRTADLTKATLSTPSGS